MLATFAELRRDMADLAAINNDIATTVDAAVRPSAVSIWTREQVR